LSSWFIVRSKKIFIFMGGELPTMNYELQTNRRE